MWLFHAYLLIQYDQVFTKRYSLNGFLFLFLFVCFQWSAIRPVGYTTGDNLLSQLGLILYLFDNKNFTSWAD